MVPVTVFSTVLLLNILFIIQQKLESPRAYPVDRALLYFVMHFLCW